MGVVVDDQKIENEMSQPKKVKKRSRRKSKNIPWSRKVTPLSSKNQNQGNHSHSITNFITPLYKYI